jgi:hypothetical protein
VSWSWWFVDGAIVINALVDEYEGQASECYSSRSDQIYVRCLSKGEVLVALLLVSERREICKSRQTPLHQKRRHAACKRYDSIALAISSGLAPEQGDLVLHARPTQRFDSIQTCGICLVLCRTTGWTQNGKRQRGCLSCIKECLHSLSRFGLSKSQV